MDLRGKYYRSTRLARFGTARSGVDSQKREILHGCMVESANAPIATFIPQAVHILPNFWESKIATCKTFTRSLPQKGGNLVIK